jgi:hypothetical protein
MTLRNGKATGTFICGSALDEYLLKKEPEKNIASFCFYSSDVITI